MREKTLRYAKMGGAKEGVGERGREKESNEVRDIGRRRRERDLIQYPDLSLLFPGNSINLLTPFIFLGRVGVLSFEIESVSNNILFK